MIARLATAALLLSIVPAATLFAQMVRVETLSAIEKGKLLSIDSESVTIEQEQNTLALSLDEVLSIRRVPARPESDSSINTIGFVELTDGSQFPYAAWELTGKSYQFVIPSKSSFDDTLKLTTDINSLRSWRLASKVSEEEITQWRMILSATRNSDLLVIRREGGALDYVDGAFETISEANVVFNLGAAQVPVTWDRISGLVFTPTQSTQPDSNYVVHGRNGLCLYADQFESNGEQFRLHSEAYSEAALLFSAIQWIDLSAGKSIYLSDLEVIRSSWKPEITWSSLPGDPQFDHGFNNGPIQLRFPDSRAPEVWRLLQYAKGLALRSNTEIVFRLPPEMSRLKGWVGIDPSVAETGSANVRVFADEELLVELELNGAVAPAPININLPASSELILKVGVGDNLDTGDIVHFADVRVTK